MSTPTTSHLIEKETDGYIEKPTAWKKGINTKEMKTFYNGKLKPTTLRKYFSSPTIPLIEGIEKEFERNRKDKWHYLDVGNEHTKEILNFLLSSLQKVESETVERCLKALPSKNFCREDNHLDAAINIGFRTCYKQSLSAIKKEFNKE